ncbi:MAG: lytic transglycosylase domain-containing protein [Eubacterium sp.]|jgi:soluble lytic murein transglycosylase|nr:lytic transglycosylase domain-containing protein [Eubacterium sp.]
MRLKSKKKQFGIGAIIMIVLIVMVLALLFKKAADYLDMQYKIMSHPLQYESAIESGAIKNDVDKYLVYAMVKTESSFNPKSESNVGARGLMQIMEDTFDWLKMKQGSENDEFSGMYDPEKNVEYGTYYIGYLIRYFEGDRKCAVAAYHAGISSVESWLKNPECSRDGFALDVIPKSDTAHYVDKIYKAYDTYIMLYEQEKK